MSTSWGSGCWAVARMDWNPSDGQECDYPETVWLTYQRWLGPAILPLPIGLWPGSRRIGSCQWRDKPDNPESSHPLRPGCRHRPEWPGHEHQAPAPLQMTCWRIEVKISWWMVKEWVRIPRDGGFSGPLGVRRLILTTHTSYTSLVSSEMVEFWICQDFPRFNLYVQLR